MTVQTSTPQTFAVNPRIPAWATGASLRINGRHEASPLMPGTFAAIRRQWRAGGRIELKLPLRTRLQPVDAEHPAKVALFAGPLLLRPGEAAAGGATGACRRFIVACRCGYDAPVFKTGNQACSSCQDVASA